MRECSYGQYWSYFFALDKLPNNGAKKLVFIYEL